MNQFNRVFASIIASGLMAGASSAAAQGAAPLATPLGNPRDWITQDDYPPAAMRIGAQGAVEVRLDIDERGWVAACGVVATSNSSALDDATCALLKRRARFVPQKAASGAAFAGIYLRTVRWSLPDDDPKPGQGRQAAIPSTAQSSPPLPDPNLRRLSLGDALSNTPTWLSAFEPLLLKAPFPTLAAIAQKCGTDQPSLGLSQDEQNYAGTGLTPPHIQGVVTVSPAQARCLILSFPDKLLVADAAGNGTLPDAEDFRFAAGRATPGNDPLAPDAPLATFMRGAIRGGQGVPILIYCHHTSCGLSYTAAQRLVRLGYTSVFWMREGSKGWEDAHYPASNQLSRWVKPYLTAANAWKSCIQAQPARTDTDDPNLLADAKIRACMPQERAAYLAIGPWYSQASADGAIVDLRKSVVSEMAEVSAKRAADAKKLAKAKADDAKWKQISSLKLSANQTHGVYEFCYAEFLDGQSWTKYITPTYAIAVPNLDDPFAEIEYFRLISDAPSGHAARFAAYVQGIRATKGEALTGCFENANTNVIETMRGLNVGGVTSTQIIPWKP